MKKSILMLMAAALLAATPVVAAEALHSGDCIQHCAQQSESITKKIERLQSEIKKGTNTYSVVELRKLEEKLAEANYMLDSITRP